MSSLNIEIFIIYRHTPSCYNARVNKILTLLLMLSTICLGSCTQQHAPTLQPQAQAGIRMKRAHVAELGQRIWMNECGGKVEGLVSWNDGEAFPSLGIGHFIWFPSRVKTPFRESFPTFVRYARAQGVRVPAFFDGPAPWRSKAAFLADRSGRAQAMRQWLAQNVEIQAHFIIARSHSSLGTMMRASRQPAAVQARYQALAATPQGMYCLVDYVNFKGEGSKGSENYNGHGWGLRQVLEEMRGYPQGRAACAEFSRAAASVLRRRVANAPNPRKEQRWLPGWLNRCATYR